MRRISERVTCFADAAHVYCEKRKTNTMCAIAQQKRQNIIKNAQKDLFKMIIIDQLTKDTIRNIL